METKKNKKTKKRHIIDIILMEKRTKLCTITEKKKKKIKVRKKKLNKTETNKFALLFCLVFSTNKTNKLRLSAFKETNYHYLI